MKRSLQFDCNLVMAKVYHPHFEGEDKKPDDLMNDFLGQNVT